MSSIKDERGYNQMFVTTPAFLKRMEKRAENIIQRGGIGKKTKVLEIGCGDGLLASMIYKKTGASITAQDISDKFVAEAKKNYPKINFFVGDFNNVESGSYDCVIGNGILHHLYPTLDKSLRSIHSLLSQNGRIVFYEPNLKNPYCSLIFRFQLFRKLANLEPGEMAFTRNFIANKLNESGFRDVRVEYRDFLLPNTPTPIIETIIYIGEVLERIPLVKNISQSLLICATI